MSACVLSNAAPAGRGRPRRLMPRRHGDFDRMGLTSSRGNPTKHREGLRPDSASADLPCMSLNPADLPGQKAPAYGVVCGAIAIALYWAGAPVLGTGFLLVGLIGLLQLAVFAAKKQRHAPIPLKEVATTLPVHIQNVIREVCADGRISDEEMQRLTTATEQAGDVALDDKTKRVIAKARLLYRLENGELPTVTVSLRLKRGEVCHASMSVKRYEPRKVTVATKSSGFSHRTRLIGGLSYSSSRIRRERITEDQLVEVDDGTLYVTNQRIFFDGQKHNVTIPHTKLADFRLLTNGIWLERDSGKDQFFAYDVEDLDLTEAIVRGALRAA
jgi:hypothetical protein